MKYLLDTHTLLWFLKGDKKLSDKALRLIDIHATQSSSASSAFGK